MPRSRCGRWSKGSRQARCEVAAHPLGLELRCSVDGDLIRSQVFRDTDALKLEAHAWQEAFGATGWWPADTP
jgi:hypothetical protein